jgi:diguanylate cyclase (GGDEF)-like protein
MGHSGEDPKNEAAVQAEGPMIFLFCDVPAQSDVYVKTLGSAGFDVRTAADPRSVSGGALMLNPAAILIDNAQPQNIADTLESLYRLYSEGRLTCPAIFVGPDDDIDLRLAAVRGGCSSFLARPVGSSSLIETLDALTGENDEPLRVLVVDDSRTTAIMHARMLEGAGMVTLVVTDPLAIAEPMKEFDPELILMDLEMPECSGKELAAVIRQEQSLDSIPIVFLSGTEDRNKQLSAMDVGGDDFLVKPIEPYDLIRSVQIRGYRFRRLHGLITRDSLTGLLNHSTCKDMLKAEVARARANGHPLAFAMIDIDHFKQVNDVHGHQVGDWVIKSLARLLKNKMRKSDMIGRIGGEEFGVILPGIDAADAAVLIDRAREEFGAIAHKAEAAEFSSTFSCGIADIAHSKQAIDLGNAADVALYEAKQGGRNQVRVAG